MSSTWLAAQSFRQMHALLSAINVVSLQIKLQLLQLNGPVEKDEYEMSVQTLQNFANGLQQLLADSETREDRVILGANPRMRRFVSQFIIEQKKAGHDNALHDFPLEQFPELLTATDRAQQLRLLEYLDQLRSLVEQHVYDDNLRIFGEGK